jgi:hypothetical protein
MRRRASACRAATRGLGCPAATCSATAHLLVLARREPPFNIEPGFIASQG